MFILIGIVLVILFSILILFSFRELSPVPYFPSNKADKKIILKALDLKNDQVVIDLGAGDGWILFEAAHVAQKKNLNTKFIQVEINPVLIGVLHIKRLLHPNRENIYIRHFDFLKEDLKKLLTFDSQFLTFYLYVSPQFIPTLTKKIQSFNKKATVVSYFYPVVGKKPSAVWEGKHTVYKY